MGSSESSLPMDEGEPNTSENSQQELSQDSSEDPWWWEIENQNLLLNVVSNEVDSSGASTSSVIHDNSQIVSKPSEQRKMSQRRSKSPPPSTMEESSSDFPSESGSAASENLVVMKKSDEIEQEIEANVRKEQSLEEFKEELQTKRMARQTAVNDLREELQSLRRQLAEERRSRSAEGTTTDEVQPTVTTSEEVKKKEMEESDRAYAQYAQKISDDEVVSESTNPKVQLAEAQLALQMANAENLSLQTELGVTRKQVVSLKEVVTCCKQMIAMKEEQVIQLKDKLSEIEDSLAERELKIMSDNLRQEYDRQLANMRTLRQLYEERARVAAAERENLERQIAIKKDELDVEKGKTKHAEERCAGLEKELENAAEELRASREQCNEHRFENKTLKEEMGAVNKLFSQMLMGFNGTNNLDIDRLTTMLEENRTLLNDMATKEANFDGATLPKLLFELVQQASVANNVKPSEIQSSSSFNASHDAAAAASASATGQTNHNDEEKEDDEENSRRDITKYCSGLTATASASEAASVQAPHPSSASAVPSLSLAPTTVCGMPTTEANISSKGNVEQTARGGHEAANNTTATTNNDESLHEDVQQRFQQKQQQQQQQQEHHQKQQEEGGGNLDHNQPRVIAKVASAEEIIGNLPKVWKVLMELLSHHKIERVQFKENGQSEDCFKSVQTPNGPKAELSVSKTYIKLKDLILEKKSLVKETNRLRTLNCHLDFRLNEQEKRLSAVSLELQKTWHLVGKMQRQHRQLHTQEQILRYQLQQKRRLLSELKDELEYCRRKWAAARAKNDESQLQCDDLRREFAKRKLEDAHNSAESGYSDGPGSDEDDNVVKKEGSLVKNWADVFEIKKTIQRMQSTSPERSEFYSNEELRWNSAPPAVTWPKDDSLLLFDDEPSSSSSSSSASGSNGAIPKKGPRTSRSKKRGLLTEENEDIDETPDGEESDRTTRIHRLEEQCKSLIAAVIETSDNRERLEVQLCCFQDEIAPTQYPITMDEFMDNQTKERMKRASSAPEIANNKNGHARLTAREEEYTRKRSERLERLEEESRQLMTRIKRTSDKGNSLRSSIERIHSRRALSREGSFESNTEEVALPEEVGSAEGEEAASLLLTEEDQVSTETDEPCTSQRNDSKLLTETEQDYTARRAERLKRLEEESKLLLSKLSKNSERGTTFNTKLDALHEKYGSEERETPAAADKIENRLENVAKMSTNREERLRILEEEGQQLLAKLSKASDRGSQMIDRISEREKNKNIRASLEHDKVENPEDLAGPSIPPTLKNVACTSIVSEEITERVVITQTPSQIAESQGAVPKVSSSQKDIDQTPKSQPTSKLCASTGRKRVAVTKTDTASESLEEMVRRLKNLPFPSESEAKDSSNEPKN